MKKNYLFVLSILLFACVIANGQSNKKSSAFFFDTLTIIDHDTHMESERVSRTRKPMKRNFSMQCNDNTYALFTDHVFEATIEDISALMGEGCSLLIDRNVHKEKVNLMPTLGEILGEDNAVLTMFNGKLKYENMKSKLKEGVIIRFSNFPIGVNEKKNGPISITFKVVS